MGPEVVSLTRRGTFLPKGEWWNLTSKFVHKSAWSGVVAIDEKGDVN